MKRKVIVPISDCSRGYRQWWRSSMKLPEAGETVRGIFNDDRELLCECSPEEGVWFIDIVVTDPPILWSYPY